MANDVSSHGTDDSDTSASLIIRLMHQPDDHDSWNRFADRYGPKIHGWCRAWRLQDADAQDLTQLVLAKLLDKFRAFNYDPAQSFRGWLRKLTRRAWTESIRKKWPVVAGGDPRIQSLIARQEAREDLVKRIEGEFDLELLDEARSRVRTRVEPRTWEAYCLTAVQGLSGIEASERLGMSAANVFKAKSNVLGKLREEVKALESRQGRP